MIWAAAYVAAFNEQGPNWIGANATLWEHYTDEVQQAVVLATEQATLTINALRAIKTHELREQCCDDAAEMVSSMLECDE